MRTHLEAVTLLPGLGMEGEDTVHTERHHTAADVLTSDPDTPPEVNMAEEDHKMDWWMAEVGIDNGVNYSEEHLVSGQIWSLRCRQDLLRKTLNCLLVCAFA